MLSLWMRRPPGHSRLLARFLKERAGKSVKPGVALVLDNVPYKVTRIVQGKRGKGGGFVRAFLKNMESSGVIEKTFTSDELVELADLEREKVEFSWIDASTDSFVFMNMESFEERRVSRDELDIVDLLKEGQPVQLLKFRDKIIGAELPDVIECLVVALEDGGAGRRAVIEAGARLAVPAFVKVGDVLRVNTSDRTYMERALD